MQGPTINARQVLGFAGAFHAGGVRATRLRNELVTQGRDTTRDVRAAIAEAAQMARRRNRELRRATARKVRHPFGDTSRYDDSDAAEIRAAANEFAAIARELDDIKQMLTALSDLHDVPGRSEAARREELDEPLTSPETPVVDEESVLDEPSVPPLTFRFATAHDTT